MLPHDKLEKRFYQWIRNLVIEDLAGVFRSQKEEKRSRHLRDTAMQYWNIQTETMESKFSNFSLNLDFENFENKTPNKQFLNNVRRRTW